MSEESIFCGYCNTLVDRVWCDNVAIPRSHEGGTPCPRCTVWMHERCWEENEGKCPRYGCEYVRTPPKTKPAGKPILPRSADACVHCTKHFLVESESFAPFARRFGGTVRRKLVHSCEVDWDSDPETQEEPDSQKLWVPSPLPHSDAVFSAAEGTLRACKRGHRGAVIARILNFATLAIFVIVITYNVILAIGEDPSGKIHCDTCICQPVGQEF